MSLVIAAKTPHAIILAADSRLTVQSGKDVVYFDRGEKLWTLMPPNQRAAVGMVGKAAISYRNAGSLIDEYGHATRTRKPLAQLAGELLTFLRGRWDGYGEATFYLAGYDETDHYGKIYQLVLPDMDMPIESYGGASFGLVLGGQRDIAQRILQGHDDVLAQHMRELELSDTQRQALTRALNRARLPLPLHLMPTGDVAKLCRYLIRATAGAQRLFPGVQGVGGAARVVVLERAKAAQWI